jgi:hypothetical protein
MQLANEQSLFYSTLHAYKTYRYSISWKLYRRLHRNGWLSCSSMRRSRMMFRTLSDRTTAQLLSNSRAHNVSPLTGMLFHDLPSSFLMYFSANVKPVSFLSTIRTLPKAPFPTTLSNRKWLRLTRNGEVSKDSQKTEPSFASLGGRAET